MCLVIQSGPTLCNPMDCNPPDSSVRGILQARILEWVAMPFSRESSWPRQLFPDQNPHYQEIKIYYNSVSVFGSPLLLSDLSLHPKHFGASLVAVTVENLPAMQETQMLFSLWIGKIPWRREWLPTPVFLPGRYHDQRSLPGSGLWDPKESDTIEQLTNKCISKTDGISVVIPFHF